MLFTVVFLQPLRSGNPVWLCITAGSLVVSPRLSSALAELFLLEIVEDVALGRRDFSSCWYLASPSFLKSQHRQVVWIFLSWAHLEPARQDARRGTTALL